MDSESGKLRVTGGMHGKGGNNLLQTPRRHETTRLSSCDGMAKVSALLCLTQNIHLVYPRQQILPSLSYQ